MNQYPTNDNKPATLEQCREWLRPRREKGYKNKINEVLDVD